MNCEANLENKLLINKNKQKELDIIFNSLPKGHINTLYRGNRGYYYLTYRSGKKINNDYLGSIGKVDLSEIISKLDERTKIKKELIELKKEAKDIEKLIRKTK